MVLMARSVPLAKDFLVTTEKSSKYEVTGTFKRVQQMLLMAAAVLRNAWTEAMAPNGMVAILNSLGFLLLGSKTQMIAFPRSLA